ncbi:hypothetical protein HYW53_01750 [Candidatus Giovannonibacteria bacterium]|nr:hypothetical protein [Candidatus Giovannonibacteria bacterium]
MVDYRHWKLIQWQRELGFKRNGAKRRWTRSDYLLHVVSNLGSICETLRKQERHETIDLLPELFISLLVFANVSKINLQEAAWRKYPGVCPSCLERQDCNCIRREKVIRTDADLDPYRQSRRLMPETLDDWQLMSSKIFGKQNQVQWREKIWYHFEEEVGEIAKALLFQGPRELSDELADAFAWYVAFSNRMAVSITNLLVAKFFSHSYSLAKIA